VKNAKDRKKKSQKRQIKNKSGISETNTEGNDGI
jgi:hypothetical protein